MKEIKIKLLKLGTCKYLREVVSILKGSNASRLLEGRKVVFVLKGFNASRLLGGKEVISILKGFDLKASRLLEGEGALCIPYFMLKLAQCTKVGQDICAGLLLLVLLDKVSNDLVIEILTTKVDITSSSQDLKDTIID